VPRRALRTLHRRHRCRGGCISAICSLATVAMGLIISAGASRSPRVTTARWARDTACRITSRIVPNSSPDAPPCARPASVPSAWDCARRWCPSPRRRGRRGWAPRSRSQRGSPQRALISVESYEPRTFRKQLATILLPNSVVRDRIGWDGVTPPSRNSADNSDLGDTCWYRVLRG
jgi:hypothetical protein